MDVFSGLLIGTLIGSVIAMSPTTNTGASSKPLRERATSGLSSVPELDVVVAASATSAGTSGPGLASVSAFSLDATASAAISAMTKTGGEITPTASKPLKPLRRRVLVFKATWCGACQTLNSEWPRLTAARWRVGSKETDHFQFVDADQRPDLIAKYAVGSLPTLLLLDGDKEVGRRGVIGAGSMADLYYEGLE